MKKMSKFFVQVVKFNNSNFLYSFHQYFKKNILIRYRVDTKEWPPVVLGTIQILRNQEGWVGGVGQMIMQ